MVTQIHSTIDLSKNIILLYCRFIRFKYEGLMNLFTFFAENFALIFVLLGFTILLISQRETPASIEKKYYWMMLACSYILLITVPLEQWAAMDIKYMNLRVFLSVVAYWARPAAVMFLIFSCLEKTQKRILIIIPELCNIVIIGMALFTKWPFYYHDTDYGFDRSAWGYTPHIVGLLYAIVLFALLLKMLKSGYKIEGGILIICLVFSAIAVYFTSVSAYEWVSFSITTSGFFHYLFVRSQKYYDELNNQIIEHKKARIEADTANNAKTKFLFNMSHDIRTPMNAIMGFSDILSGGVEDPEKIKEYAEKIRVSGNYLLSLINEMLEMARIESGTIVIEEKSESISNIIDAIPTIFGTELLGKNLDFTYNKNISHEYVYCDATRFFQILFNIVSNSIKYTPNSGKIHVEVCEKGIITKNTEEYIHYEITISDNGIGMAPEYIPHIFDEFSREHNSTDSKINGTGLGMTIVKKLVDSMNGEISVTSELNKGTTTTLNMFFKPANKDTKVESVSEASSPVINAEEIRILLAEDNDLNAEIAITLLGDYGYKVTRVEDGIKCIEVLESDNTYDIVLMDVQMPNLNGYDTAKKIRSMEDSHISSLPIIAMTANAFDEDRNKAIESGMNDHISKPVNMEELNTKIRKYVNKNN